MDETSQADAENDASSTPLKLALRMSEAEEESEWEIVGGCKEKRLEQTIRSVATVGGSDRLTSRQKGEK